MDFDQKGIFILIYYAALIAIYISNLTQSILYYQNINLGSQYYDYPLNNWKSELIYDFEIGEPNCRNDTIFLHRWPGTDNGCNCQAGDNRQGNCCLDSSNHICSMSGQDCRGAPVPAANSKYIDIWELQDTTFKLCAQRIHGYSFALETPGDSTCNQGNDVKCGNGQTMFCVPNSFKCPIRRIAIGQQNDTELNKQYEQKIELTSNYNLFISRKDQEGKLYPISQFRVAQGNTMCLRNSYSVGTPGRTPFVFLDSQTDPTCYQDQRFINISDIGEKRLFFLGNILDVLASFPQPGYQVDDKYKYYGFYNQYTKLNLNCRYLMPTLLQNQALLKEIEEMAFGILILSCMAAGAFLVTDLPFGLTQAMYTKNDDNFQIGNVLCITSPCQSYPEAMCCVQLFILIRYILIIGFLSMISMIKDQIVKELTFLDTINEKNCSDDYLKASIEEINNTITSKEIDTIIALLVILIFIDPTMIYLYRKVYLQNYPQKQSDVQVISELNLKEIQEQQAERFSNVNIDDSLVQHHYGTDQYKTQNHDESSSDLIGVESNHQRTQQLNKIFHKPNNFKDESQLNNNNQTYNQQPLPSNSHNNSFQERQRHLSP